MKLRQFFTNILKHPQAKPLLLLDIDGVLSFEGAAEDESFTTVESDWTTWRIKDAVRLWLIGLVKGSTVDIMWASAWEDESNAITRELAMTPFTYVSMADNEESDWLKTEGLLQFLESDEAAARPLIVWLDDEFNAERVALFSAFPNLLCYTVNRVTGLTNEDMKRVNTLIRNASQ